MHSNLNSTQSCLFVPSMSGVLHGHIHGPKAPFLFPPPSSYDLYSITKFANYVSRRLNIGRVFVRDLTLKTFLPRDFARSPSKCTLLYYMALSSY